MAPLHGWGKAFVAHDVFISYSSQDKPTADAACATLESRGIRCWVAPRDVLPGEDYPSALVRAINQSKVVVFIFSSHSNDSPHVARELERAANRSIPILPLRIEDVTPSPSVEYFISRTHWLDAITPPLKKHLERLAETARLLITPRDAEGAGSVPPPPQTATVAAMGDRFPSRRLWLGLAGAGIAVLALGLAAVFVLADGGGGDDDEKAVAATDPPGASTPAIARPSAAPTASPASSPPVGAEGYAMLAEPQCRTYGAPVEVRWTAADYKTGDIVTFLPTNAKNSDYSLHEWVYVSTAGGRVIFPAAESGEGFFEARLIRQGTNLSKSSIVSLQQSCPGGQAATSQTGYRVTASPACVPPQEAVDITWSGPDQQTGDIIVGLPTNGRNDQYSQYEWEYISTASGNLVFPAPDTSGEYEVRLLRSGNHLAVSAPIQVSTTC
jgi:hypothetical protein